MAPTSASPTTVRRPQARAEATRSALLDAALHEFSAHGFAGASTRRIATAAGTRQPQINYYFDTKESLWRAAVDYLFERLETSIAAHRSELPDPHGDRDEFAATIRAFVYAVAGLPELHRIMVQEATIESGRLDWIVEHHTRPWFDRLTAQWQRLRAEGVVAQIDETVLYYTLVGAASLPYVNAPEARLLGHDTLQPWFIEAHADALVAMLLGGASVGGPR